MSHTLMNNHLIKNLYDYSDYTYKYIMDRSIFRYMIGLMISSFYILGLFSINTIVKSLYFGLFIYSCHEILDFHTKTLYSSEKKDIMKILQYWMALYSYDFSFNTLTVLSEYFDNLFLCISVRLMFFSLLLYTIQDISKEFKQYPINSILYAKRVNLYENKEQNTVNKIVNTSINFYRVNMKFYDYCFLELIPTLLNNVFSLCFDSYGFAIDFLFLAYGQMKIILEFIRDKYITTADPDFTLAENLLIESQHMEKKLNNTINEKIISNVSDFENDIELETFNSNKEVKTDNSSPDVLDEEVSNNNKDD